MKLAIYFFAGFSHLGLHFVFLLNIRLFCIKMRGFFDLRPARAVLLGIWIRSQTIVHRALSPYVAASLRSPFTALSLSRSPTLDSRSNNLRSTNLSFLPPASSYRLRPLFHTQSTYSKKKYPRSQMHQLQSLQRLKKGSLLPTIYFTVYHICPITWLQ